LTGGGPLRALFAALLRIAESCYAAGMKSSIVLALAAFCLTACLPATQAEPAPAAPARAPLAGPAQAGYALSEALCSGCHAIKPGEISPNPMSPTFEMIANAKGLTRETLSGYLRNSHNFPENMNFEVAEEDGDVLAAYIITLRSDDYTPPIQ
jgi:mono/diheme cytochrome c family protein